MRNRFAYAIKDKTKRIQHIVRRAAKSSPLDILEHNHTFNDTYNHSKKT